MAIQGWLGKWRRILSGWYSRERVNSGHDKTAHRNDNIAQDLARVDGEKERQKRQAVL